MSVTKKWVFFLPYIVVYQDNRLLWWLSSKRIPCQCRRFRCYPWVRKIPWRRKRQPTPLFLPGKSHGQRSLVGYSPWGPQESDMTKPLSTHTFTRVTRFQRALSVRQLSLGHSLPTLFVCKHLISTLFYACSFLMVIVVFMLMVWICSWRTIPTGFQTVRSHWIRKPPKVAWYVILAVASGLLLMHL